MPGPALAELSGRVVAVHDGDSLTLQVQGRKVRVRLDGIDAPEPGQRFGTRATRSLANICRGKEAIVNDRGKDETGRVVGSVTCDGVDANAEQVKRGMAWVFRTYLPLGSPLYELESNARLRGLGLWRDSDPVPPWEWRKKQAAGR
jgi:endonuclease YncB( thermonuclease family)